jgi:hypothetical protein
LATIPLHRAARIQDQIRGGIARLSFESEASISIFSSNPDADLGRRMQRLREDLAKLPRYLAIQTDIRASIGRQNAAIGIGALLAEKAAVEEEISILSRLIDCEIAPRGLRELSGLSRHRTDAGWRRDQISIAEQIRATRARFESAEGQEEDDVLVPMLDQAHADEVQTRLVMLRRRLEEHADKLRDLNSSTTVEIEDQALQYLQNEGVI